MELSMVQKRPSHQKLTGILKSRLQNTACCNMEDDQTFKDVKVFLRSTLASKLHGIKQSKIEEDYEQLVGEILPWKKLGFKSVFHLLVSIPDVAKLEWREEDEDNRVFAVLDEGSYASLHAKRMAVKGFGRGSKALSPEEIKQWKRERSSTSESDVAREKDKVNKKIKKNYKKNKFANQFIEKKSSDKIIPSRVNHEGATERIIENYVGSREGHQVAQGICIDYDEFRPSCRGLFSLCVRIKNAQESTLNKNEAEKMVRNLSNIPGCNLVEAKAYSEKMVFTRYKTLNEAVTAMKQLNGHCVDGLTLEVKPAAERLHSSSQSHSMPTPAIPSSLDFKIPKTTNIPKKGYDGPTSLLPTPQIVSQQPGLLPTPTPSVMLNVVPIQYYPKHQNEAFIQRRVTNDQEKFISNESLSQISDGDDIKSDISDMNNGSRIIESEENHNGFFMNGIEFVPMCLKSTGQRPKFAKDYPDKVVFIVTFSVDPSRFWIHLREQESAVIGLMNLLQTEMQQLEAQYASNVFPSPRQFGAAKYSEDGLWYRCWVLSCNKERNEIHIFYCDYGNDEVVPLENFRYTGKSVWSLMPQATPVKLHGVEIAEELDKEHWRKGLDKLNSCCIGKLLQADVVKEMKESHIIELKNVTVKGCNGRSLEDIMLQSGYLKKTEVSKDGVLGNGKSENANDVMEITVSENTLLAFQNNREQNGLHDIDTKDKKLSSSVTHDGNKSSLTMNLQASHISKEKECELQSNEGGVIDSHIKNLQSCSSLFKINPSMVMRAEILAVESPKLFFFKHISTNNLQQKVKALLAASQPEENADPVVGSRVFLCNGDEKLRVDILDMACNFAYSKKVLVIDVDTGIKIWSDVADLFVLSKELVQIPEVVLKGALAGIVTKNRVTKISSMLNELSNQEIFAHVIKKDSTGLFHLEIFEGKHNKSMNYIAVERNLACLADKRKVRRKPYKHGEIHTRATPSAVFDLNGDNGGLFTGTSFIHGDLRSRSDMNSISSESAPSDDGSSSVQMDLEGDMLSENASLARCYNSSETLQDGKAKQSQMSHPYSRNLDTEDDRFNVIPVGKLRNGEVEITAVYKETAAESDKNAASRNGRYTPKTPPFPGSYSNEPVVTNNICDQEAVKNLLISIGSLQEGLVMNSLISFNQDGSLNRNLIEFEMKRWEDGKRKKESYVKTLNEALAMSTEAARMYVGRSRQKRLGLHASIMTAEKQMNELTEALNDIENKNH